MRPSPVLLRSMLRNCTSSVNRRRVFVGVRGDIEKYDKPNTTVDKFHEKEVEFVEKYSRYMMMFGIYVACTVPFIIYVTKIYTMEVNYRG